MYAQVGDFRVSPTNANFFQVPKSAQGGDPLYCGFASLGIKANPREESKPGKIIDVLYERPIIHYVVALEEKVTPM